MKAQSRNLNRTTPGPLREADRRIRHTLETGALRLSLNGLALREIPDAVSQLKNLRHLVLSNNTLSSISDFVWEMENLEFLDLENNQLMTLPEEIGKLKNLAKLNLFRNQLSALPLSLESLPRLKFMDIRENLPLGIPPEIATERDGSGPAPVANIFSFYFHSEIRYLNEAKILLVGQGGVGKTSLVKRLLRNEFDHNEQKTEGISINRWLIPAKLSKGESDKNIQLNIWDFGGQEIMHATHQFFLTKRSLYLLVLDARKGENESNIQYWLKIIQSYGGDSPVIVVTNKSDAHTLELNANRLKKDYAPNIIEFFNTSCVDGRGIAELRNAIMEQIHELPHVYDILPTSYFSVKKELEQLARRRDFIDISEYESLCTKYGVRAEQEQNRLLRFLHDLGSVLNFDDPEDPFQLRETNILNPEWITGGVYKILNNNALMQARGILEFNRLHEVLGPAYPRSRYRFILDVMRKFELCFEFPDTNGQQLLIPELLSRNEPDVDWDYSDALNFEYHYRVLPPGFICRFIVRMRANLTDKPTYWRSGVILEIDGNKALVRADVDSAKIFVSVRGAADGRRRALSVVRNTFRSIHATIPRIEPVEKVPISGSENVVVDYNHLLRLEQREVETFLPEGADREYSVDALLDGIEPRPARRRRLDETELPSNKEAQGGLGKIAMLSAIFLSVLLILIGSLAIISLYTGVTALGLITVAGILFLVIVITMVGAFTNIIPTTGLFRILDLVFTKIPRVSLSNEGNEAEPRASRPKATKRGRGKS